MARNRHRSPGNLPVDVGHNGLTRSKLLVEQIVWKKGRPAWMRLLRRVAAILIVSDSVFPGRTSVATPLAIVSVVHPATVSATYLLNESEYALCGEVAPAGRTALRWISMKSLIGTHERLPRSHAT